MKAIQKSGLYKLLAFVLIATVLVCSVGIAVNGWQASDGAPDSGGGENNNSNTDENKDGENNGGSGNIPDAPIITIPDYLNYLTGLECTEQMARTKPLCFIYDASSPIYGLAQADIVMEFPTEQVSNRLAVYHASPSVLGKIGSIAAARDYITTVLRAFGGIYVSYGNDDTVQYAPEYTDISVFDLLNSTGYCYTENSNYIYTNGDLIAAGLRNSGVNQNQNAAPELPFRFVAYGAEEISHAKSGTKILLPYNDHDETELYYSADDGVYVYMKNGTAKTDMLTGGNVTFKNCFVLFADSATYESATSTETVMATGTEGIGYYCTNGTAIAIRWAVDDSGALSFYDESGTLLTVNRGNSYIAYYKSSGIEKVTVE